MDPHAVQTFYFDRKQYFVRFVSDPDLHFDQIIDNNTIKTNDKPISRHIRHALEYFVNDLRHNRQITIERFLRESNADDILRAVASLLLSNDDRICGNSAYILGSIVEIDSGLKRFLTIFSQQRTTKSVDIVRILSQLLSHNDSECILNAAGTLGTICSSREGRQLILQHTCIAQLVVNTSVLLSSNNQWIASNAALVLARLTVEEIGCQTILTHSKHRDILKHLIDALDINDPSRATNAAFAVGRLIEGNEGKKIIIGVCGEEKLFDALLKMLEAHEGTGVNKNACYALSCLCTTQYGFDLCLQSLTIFHRILQAVEAILISLEHETVWFALMCLRTIAQYEGADEHLCYSNKLPDKLKDIREKWNKSADIQEEAKALWYIIHRNVKPVRVQVDECQTNSAEISWILNINNWNDQDLQYRVILNDLVIAQISERRYRLQDLKPNTNYNVQIQYVTSYGDSKRSDPTIFRTEEELPPTVNNLQVLRVTMTAARISWEAPNLDGCESFKGYQIYLNDVEHECVTECVVTLSSLSASTTYQIDVCAVTNKGKGPKATIDLVTASAGDSLPPPPTFSVIGRREIHVKWQAPEAISGRLTRYELLCNGRCIYTGTDQEYRVTMLKSDTEYSMEVIVITNEGRFRSRPAKTRTLKDEYNLAHRHSLYEPPTQAPARLKRTETVHFTPTNSHSNTSNTTHVAPKITSHHDRRSLRETVSVPHRNVDITTVRALQLKSENTSPTRAPINMTKTIPTRPIPMTNTVVFRRAKTEINATNQTRISAAVIVPKLDYDRENQVRWATQVNHHVTRTKSYRLSTMPDRSPILTGPREVKRCGSTSLPDLCIN